MFTTPRFVLFRPLLAALALALVACGGSSSTDAAAPATGAVPPSTAGSSGSSNPPAPVLLSIALAGSGQGQVAGPGVDCGSDCTESVAVGQRLTLQAVAAPGSQFDGWGGACQGVQPTCEVSLQEARTVVASFVPPRTLDQPVDAVIAAMPPNSWARLPATQMSDVCPLPYLGYYCTSVVKAWSGGAYDARRDRMIIYGGGHSDSYYNNIFAFDLAAMRWERLSEMGGGATGDTPGVGWDDKRIEPCGFYPKGPLNLPDEVMRGDSGYVDPTKCFEEPILSQLDLQQPRSAHTYGKVLVDSLRDRYCYLGGDSYPSSQTDSYVVVCFDPHSRRWERVAERPHKATGRGQAAVDADGNWWYLTSGNANVLRYDPRFDQWTEYGNINSEAGGGADIDRLRNHFYTLVPQSTGYVLRRFDLGSPASLNAKPAYTQLEGVTNMPDDLGTRPGFVYADGLDRIFAWGGSNAVHVYDPQTRSWQVIAASGEAPGAQQPNGTYGRWRYSTNRKVFVLVNSATEDVYLFKPAL